MYEDNPYMLLSNEDSFFEKVYVGFHLNDLGNLLLEELDFSQVYNDSSSTNFDSPDLSHASGDFDEKDVVGYIKDYGFDSIEEKSS